MYRTLYELAEKTEADIPVTGAFVEVESDGRQEILENPAAAGLYTGEKLEKLREKMLYSGHFTGREFIRLYGINGFRGTFF